MLMLSPLSNVFLLSDSPLRKIRDFRALQSNRNGRDYELTVAVVQLVVVWISLI